MNTLQTKLHFGENKYLIFYGSTRLQSFALLLDFYIVANQGHNLRELISVQVKHSIHLIQVIRGISDNLIHQNSCDVGVSLCCGKFPL